MELKKLSKLLVVSAGIGIYSSTVLSNQIVDAQEQTEEVKQESRTVRAIKAVETEEDLSQFEQDIQTMSVDELNQIIDHVAVEGRQRGTTRSSSLKAAWKAAATIARNVGFPHAATLVEHSVDGRNYTEKNGSFSSTIKQTAAYNRIKNKDGSGSDRFTKSDSTDLFYAIHKFSYSFVGSDIRITDTFDFEANTNYQNGFATWVNNWGYLNQNMGILKPINVRITISP